MIMEDRQITIGNTVHSVQYIYCNEVLKTSIYPETQIYVRRHVRRMHLPIYTIYKFEKVANVKSFVKEGAGRKPQMTKQHQSFTSCPWNMKYFYVHWYMQTAESIFAKVKNKCLLSLHRSKILNTVCRQIIYWYLDVKVPVPCSRNHWLGDKVNSGIGLSYRQDRLHGWRVGTTTLCRSWLHPPVRDLWIRLLDIQ